jgi:hypothetical protein
MLTYAHVCSRIILTLCAMAAAVSRRAHSRKKCTPHAAMGHNILPHLAARLFFFLKKKEVTHTHTHTHTNAPTHTSAAGQATPRQSSLCLKNLNDLNYLLNYLTI